MQLIIYQYDDELVVMGVLVVEYDDEVEVEDKCWSDNLYCLLEIIVSQFDVVVLGLCQLLTVCLVALDEILVLIEWLHTDEQLHYVFVLHDEMTVEADVNDDVLITIDEGVDEGLDELDVKMVALERIERNDETEFVDMVDEVDEVLDVAVPLLEAEQTEVVLVDMAQLLDALDRIVDDDEVEHLVLLEAWREIELVEQLIYAMLAIEADEYTVQLEEIVAIYVEIYVSTDLHQIEHLQQLVNLILNYIIMTNTILILIACSTVITSIVNAAKPAYKKFSGKFTVTISVLLSFALGIVASFSVAPYLLPELNTGLLVLVGLALGTGSNLFYDLWELLKSATDKIRSTIEK